ncbi:RNA polymerase sigma factor, sigma-70 family protein (plasmid) [Burkholderia thailandensis 34]|uniref:sigma-70 family RNA polymerase sigma factor n=1 Tax=Burkholderia thailandensis TaxID=57975 RepID=UPI00070697A9|nr:sigma-70 family RNA polymerase sigma factor [Burkholderia thailandensis]AJY27014.1 RNA polymerase sigma factor, sigma-70 family protein [Burkholderia thailandensis 34]
MDDQRDSRWVALMKAAQAGDPVGYAALLREVSPFLRRLARQGWPKGNAADIEDIVQETLLTLHAVRHTFDPARPFTPWLLALLRRRIADGVRKRVRTGRHEIGMDLSEVTFSIELANTAYERQADSSVLRYAISQLPPGQRQAIELLKLREMSLKQAAAVTGLSVTALKVATHRGLKALRVMLAIGK